MPHEHFKYAASWSDTGKVHIWDMTDNVKSLDVPGSGTYDIKPVHTISSHREEGYAMNWSSRTMGK